MRCDRLASSHVFVLAFAGGVGDGGSGGGPPPPAYSNNLILIMGVLGMLACGE